MKLLILFTAIVFSIQSVEAATLDDEAKAALIKPGIVCASAYVSGDSQPDQILALADAALRCLQLGGVVVPNSTYYCSSSGVGSPDGGGATFSQCSVECRTCSRDIPTHSEAIVLD